MYTSEIKQAITKLVNDAKADELQWDETLYDLISGKVQQSLLDERYPDDRAIDAIVKNICLMEPDYEDATTLKEITGTETLCEILDKYSDPHRPAQRHTPRYAGGVGVSHELPGGIEGELRQRILDMGQNPDDYDIDAIAKELRDLPWYLDAPCLAGLVEDDELADLLEEHTK